MPPREHADMLPLTSRLNVHASHLAGLPRGSFVAGGVTALPAVLARAQEDCNRTSSRLGASR